MRNIIAKWLSAMALVSSLLAAEIQGGPPESRSAALILNQVGEILKIDLQRGRVLSRSYIPEAYYSTKVLADPAGRYVAVTGGAQLAQFLDPKSLNIRATLKPEIPRRPWESDALFSERLSGFSSVYGGNWAISADGSKIYFSGEVPELKPTVVIDPSTHEITNKLSDFVIYPHSVLSRDGKLICINHRRTRELITVDTRSDQIVKRFQAPPGYEGFQGPACLDSQGTGLLLMTARKEGGRCLVRVDLQTGSLRSVMENPFLGKSASHIISSGGRYLVYNEFMTKRKEPDKSHPNQYEAVYSGEVSIVDLTTQERQILSLGKRYPAEKWNLDMRLCMVPKAEKALLVIVEKFTGDWRPRLRWRKLPQACDLVVVDLPTATVKSTIEIPEGGFRDLAFLPPDS